MNWKKPAVQPKSRCRFWKNSRKEKADLGHQLTALEEACEKEAGEKNRQGLLCAGKETEVQLLRKELPETEAEVRKRLEEKRREFNRLIETAKQTEADAAAWKVSLEKQFLEGSLEKLQGRKRRRKQNWNAAEESLENA